MLSIKDVPQWICWDINADGVKIPKDRWGDKCGSSWRTSYSAFSLADEGAKQVGLMGPAWCFTPEDAFFGVDLDDCLTEGDCYTALSWAKPIIDKLLDCQTYFEISPSCRGIKAWFHGHIPDGWKTKAPVEDGLIELFGKSHQYFTFTGCRWIGSPEKIADGREFLNWLLHEYFERLPEPAEPRPNPRVPLGSWDHQRRLNEYANSLDIAGPKTRNNAAFRYAGNLFAILSESGERPTFEMIREALLPWNARLAKPRSEEELCQCIRNGIEKGTAREIKQPKERETADPAWAAGIRNEFAGDSESRIDCEIEELIEEESQKKDGFPDELLTAPGFIAEFIDLTLRTAIYRQPQFALSTALTFLGALVGRKVRGPMNVRSNLYTINIGPAACGKDHPRAVAKWLEYHAGTTVLGPEGCGSGQGLIKAVETLPSVLLQVDEIGEIFQQMSDKNTWLKSISTNLLKLYSSSGGIFVGDAVADVRKIPRINQPCLSIIGTSTPDSFWRGMGMKNVLDGLLPRMHLAYGKCVHYCEEARDLHRESAGWLIDECRWWSEQPFGPKGDPLEQLHPEPRTIEYTAESQFRWMSHTKEIASRRLHEGRVPSAIWGRTAERTAKLALILACSRNRETKTIEIEDVERAILLSNWSTRLMVEKIGQNVYDAENEVERNFMRVLSVIQRHPGGLSRSQLLRATRWVKARELQDLINSLIESRLIVVEEKTVKRKTKSSQDRGDLVTFVYRATGKRGKKQGVQK